MKKSKGILKKILGTFAALAMAVGVVSATTVSANAAGNTITIENAQPNQQYQLYKLFNATTNENRQQGTSITSGIAYNYTLDSNTKSLNASYQFDASDGTKHTVAGTDWFTIDDAGNVKAKENTNTTSLATENFQQWAKWFGEKVGDSKSITGNQEGTLTFDNLTDGYYFVTSTMGSLVTVTSVAPNATVKDKNGTPATTKAVDVKTSSVGETVTYTVEINIPTGASNVIFHDKLGTGLDLQGSESDATIYVGSKETDTNSLDASNYQVNTWTSSPENNGDNIKITFTDAYLRSVTQETVLHLTYTAKLNVSATVNMPNDAWVTYGSNNTESEKSRVYESSFSFKVNKLDGSNNNVALNGAKFVLSKNGNLGNLTEANYSEKNNELLSFNNGGVFDPNGTNKLFTADNSIEFKGLNDNENDNQVITYYLYEVKAPDGYSKLTGPVAIKITPTFDPNANNGTLVTSYKVEYQNHGETTWNQAVNDNGVATTSLTENHNINIINSQGSVLPSTGGIGTTIFYIAGGILIIGAAVLLIARRKRNA